MGNGAIIDQTRPDQTRPLYCPKFIAGITENSCYADDNSKSFGTAREV